MLTGSRPRERGGAALSAAGLAQGEGLLRSAELSQRRYIDEDLHGGEALFPRQRYDEDLQQVDLREVNSWRLRLTKSRRRSCSRCISSTRSRRTC